MKLTNALRSLSFLLFTFALFSSISAQTPTPAPAATPPISEDDTVITVNSRLVVVPVSVTDAGGNPVSGLTAQEFRLSEEGKAQAIDNVGNAENVPLEIAILFDVSATTFSMFKFQQETAAKFLREVMRPDDRATIFTIGIRPVLIQARDTAEKSQIGMQAIAPTKEQTAFYDSVRYAADHLAKNSPSGRRKVLVVISDGEDTNSDGVIKAIIAAENKIAADVKGEELRTLRARARDTAKVKEQLKVLKSLQDADSVFYSINPGGSSIQLNRSAQFGQENLQKFADDTGGTAYLPKFLPIDTVDTLANASNTRKNTATLEGIFKQLANELRAQYLVQYYSESEYPTNKFVKLNVALQNPAGRKLRARQGYFVKNQ